MSQETAGERTLFENYPWDKLVVSCFNGIYEYPGSVMADGSSQWTQRSVSAAIRKHMKRFAPALCGYWLFPAQKLSASGWLVLY